MQPRTRSRRLQDPPSSRSSTPHTARSTPTPGAQSGPRTSHLSDGDRLLTRGARLDENVASSSNNILEGYDDNSQDKDYDEEEPVYNDPEEYEEEPLPPSGQREDLQSDPAPYQTSQQSQQQSPSQEWTVERVGRKRKRQGQLRTLQIQSGETDPPSDASSTNSDVDRTKGRGLLAILGEDRRFILEIAKKRVVEYCMAQQPWPSDTWGVICSNAWSEAQQKVEREAPMGPGCEKQVRMLSLPYKLC